MAATSIITPQPAIARLEWESNHFGLFAAQFTSPHVDDDALVGALQAARRQGVQLLVWATGENRQVDEEVLADFGGILADRKATFGRSLEGNAAGDSPRPHDAAVVKYTNTEVSPGLLELALEAGGYSRFRVDPHFKHDKFADMYRTWIERSVSGEMADEVLVARLEGKRDQASPAGMITIEVTDGVATIGLVAVAAEARGRGVGTTLMRAAHRWMRDRGAQRARVVTQLTNAPACRLYERAGYELQRVQNYYHFWL